MKKIIQFLFILFIIVSIIFTSCKKDKTPPPLPPEFTFNTDLSNQSTKTTKSLDTTAPVTYGNVIYAGLNVVFWNIVIWVNLAVPVAAYSEALKTEAEYVSKNKWKWEFSKQIDSGYYKGSYTCELYAKLNDNDIAWSMYISKAGEYTNFLWYTGTSTLDANSGSWYLKNVYKQDYIEIVWSRNTTNNTAQIKYSIVQDVPEKGSYIEYGSTTNTNYNVYYKIFGSKDNNLVNIEYNTTNKNGRVSNALHFKDAGQWHCWDKDAKDNLNCN